MYMHAMPYDGTLQKVLIRKFAKVSQSRYGVRGGGSSLLLTGAGKLCPLRGNRGGVVPGASSKNMGAKQSKQILWLICPGAAPSVRCQRIVCWHQAHTILKYLWRAMDWRDCAINSLAVAMSTRESWTNWRLRWMST